MNFKYKYFITPNDSKRPLIRIKIRKDKIELPILALIDSGADFNIFHSDLTEVLGISLDGIKPIKMSGVSEKAGEFRCYQKVIELGLEGYWFETPAYFSDGISRSGYSILGQQGFFDHFKSIRFTYGKANILLKK